MSSVNPVRRIFLFVLITVSAWVSMATQASDAWLGSGERAPADVPGLATTGPSGGLNIPDGRTLPDGTLVVGYNNSMEPQFYYNYVPGTNYTFGIGLLPYVELSGRLTNYPVDSEGNVGVRHISGNVKVSLPKFFSHQPDIAFGYNDPLGGTRIFNNKYVAVSDSFGPLRLTAGAASGQSYLSSFFGGAELALGNTGLSVMAEHNNGAVYGGVRYSSVPIPFLSNAQVVVTAQRSYGAHAHHSYGAYVPDGDGAKFFNSSLGVNLVIPFGKNAHSIGRFALELEPISTPPAGYENGVPQSASTQAHGMLVAPSKQDSRMMPQSGQIWASPAGYEKAATQQQSAHSMPPQASEGLAAKDTRMAVAGLPLMEITPLQRESLQRIQDELIKTGLERVRVGLDGETLIIEYENHRYNQNEVDAIGISLGISAMLAPKGVEDIAVVTKKAGLALYMTSVDQAAYRQFMRNAEAHDVKYLLTFQYRPVKNDDVHWYDEDEGAHGYSRIQIDPSLVKFVGTEIGVFDYSLAANVQGFIPLWKGAELTTNYLVNLAETQNVAHGILSYAQQRPGFSAAILSQSFWLSDRILDVASIGKFANDYTGLQNEAVYFVPGGNDQVRLQYTHLRGGDEFSANKFGIFQKKITAGSVSYLWNYQPLDASVEMGYNHYIGNDTGPSVQFNRWFGDIQAQVYIRRSNLETIAGFGLAFPLTPRQGMRPGISHLEGSSSYPLTLETVLATPGQCNCILTTGVVKKMPFVYSSRNILLNQDRIGKDYLLSRLQRMREAALVYAPPAL